MYAGIDGCREGWFCVELGPGEHWNAALLPVAEIGRIAQSARIVLIDIPIGLVESGTEERDCDRYARRALGRPRASSVFPAPARATLNARTYRQALAANRRLTGRGISRQTWAIVPKIRAIDTLLRSNARLRGRLHESHPEICFWALNHAGAMRHNKKTAAGRRERLAVLRRFFRNVDRLLAHAVTCYRRRQVARDDILDATALAVTARLGAGRYLSLPARPAHDSAGLPMKMLYFLP